VTTAKKINKKIYILQWFNDSAEDIRSCCDKALQALRANYGWQVRPAAARGWLWLWLIQFSIA
jgi:hypothetical protein